MNIQEEMGSLFLKTNIAIIPSWRCEIPTTTPIRINAPVGIFCFSIVIFLTQRFGRTAAVLGRCFCLVEHVFQFSSANARNTAC